MKVLLLSIWLCLGTISAFAQNNQGNNNNNQGNNNNGQHQAAPAPLIGFGIPAALAIGGVLLGAKFLNRKR
jgi:hypothetical protein